MIGPAAGGKDLAPAVLGVAQHQRDKLAGGTFGVPGVTDGAGLVLLGGQTEAVEQVEDHVRIHAKIPAYQADDDDGSDAETAPTSRHPARCARLAIVFDIAAGTEIIGAHLSYPIAFRWSCRAARQYPTRHAAKKGCFCQITMITRARQRRAHARKPSCDEDGVRRSGVLFS